MQHAGTRRFRFGHQLRPAGPIGDLIAEAQAAEAAGFDVVTIPDHIGDTMTSPMILAAAIARETTAIRISTFVLNNEMRNPVQLAWEAAAVDRMSDGRFELGIGAGHTPHEFAATGLPMRPATERKERLAESVEILRALLDGETVTREGNHYTVEGAAIEAPTQDHLPILVGGNGRALLTHAGTVADIVGLNGLSKTLEDGHRHSLNWSPDRLDLQVQRVREGAADRPEMPELNALVQRVEITDDRPAAATAIAENAEGLTVDDALVAPYLFLGSHEEIAAQCLAARERWGISYFVSRDIDNVAPVIARLRGE
jgi:probable F420-dependent oxidoreductase